MESYDFRFQMPPEQREEHDYSPDEDETKDDLALISNDKKQSKGPEETLGWAERKLHWFKVKQNKRILITASSILLSVGSLGLIVTSAVRFALIKSQSFQDVVLNLYYLFFGVVLIIAQLQLQWTTLNFRFLNYHWGRGLFCIFLASMSCSSSGEAFL